MWLGMVVIGHALNRNDARRGSKRCLPGTIRLFYCRCETVRSDGKRERDGSAMCLPFRCIRRRNVENNDGDGSKRAQGRQHPKSSDQNTHGF